MLSNKFIYDWLLTLVLCVLFADALPAQSANLAQSGKLQRSNNSAHRKLERPAGGSSGVQKQIELIKRLQSLMQNRNQQPPDNSEGLSSLQKNMMDSVLRQFENGSALPDLSSLPPELVGKVMSDPKARQDVKDMLEKFQQDRKFPERNGNNGLPLPSEDPNSGQRFDPDAAPNSRQPANRPQPNFEPQPNPGQPNKDRTNGNQPDTDQTNRNPLDRDISTAEQRPPLQPRRPSTDRNNQRRLGQPDSGNQRRGDANPARLPGDDTGSPPIQESGERDSDYLDRYSDFIEREINRQRENGTTKPLDSSELPNQPGTQRPSSPQGSRRTDNEGADASQLPPTISDLLEELGGLPQLPPPDRSAGSQSQPGTSANQRQQPSRRNPSESNKPSPPNSTGQSANAAEEARSAEDAKELEERKEELKKELGRSGLKSTLRKIVKEAREQIRSNPTAQSSANGSRSENKPDAGGGLFSDISPGMEKAIIRSLDSLGKDVLEMAKDGKLTSPKSPSEDKPASASSAEATAPATAAKPSSSSWGKRASDFISDVVTPAPEPPSSTSSASANGDSALDALPAVSFSWVPIVILGCILFFVFGFAVKSGVIGSDSQNQNVSVSGQFSNGLRTRKDVVKAFHQLALKPEHDAESWWTHQQVKRELKAKVPSKNKPIEVLASVYEQARYLPEDSSLNEQQLEEARVALKRCES